MADPTPPTDSSIPPADPAAPPPAAAAPAGAAPLEFPTTVGSGASFGDNPIDASEIDELLKQAATFADPTAAVAAAIPSPAAEAPHAAPSPQPEFGDLPDQASIEELLRQATFEDPGSSGSGHARHDATSGGGGAQVPLVGAEDLKLPNFNQVIQEAQVSSIDLLRDVELNVKIELGRSRMLVEDVLRLAEGSVVELDKLAGDPVDVFVNDRLVARGEVLVLNDYFCVRVNEIVTASKDEGL
jgi:flagellar motor switch protein FliN/FliY